VDINVNNHRYTGGDNMRMPSSSKKSVPKDTSFHDRMKTAMKMADITSQAALMRHLKINRGTAHKWWHGLTGVKTMRAVDLFKIAAGLKVSPTWLLTGEGPMLPGKRLSADEHRVLEVFNAFTPEREDWRDNWVSAGIKQLQLLDLEPSNSNPFPKVNKIKNLQ
jgi:hypothetical protein